jgi:hypothetical protein
VVGLLITERDKTGVDGVNVWLAAGMRNKEYGTTKGWDEM